MRRGDVAIGLECFTFVPGTKGRVKVVVESRRDDGNFVVSRVSDGKKYLRKPPDLHDSITP
jgi:hypothetical protein